ncbi:CRISPR-associated RAMP protein, SSO1426 family [Rhodothermus marinus SG0.5JP17-172]|uniref:type III CRISPR-associated RAMP protein Csx7 n=1 Tax=Rhodothermus marinus TaxID=29549 RepID=UPI000223DB4A|nr:CRISPR-associated RAMP protein Csx7 [Rhodothermus marinus]AEN73084.1 CRISPR-associated RAMP protein, SSO1426 family [Rhodothermus marinus SG0.5JP17-172]
MADFWRFENRTIIESMLVMRTALSVGSRASFLPAGTDLPVIKTPEGIPYIPGSSLKGVVRSYVERLLRTIDALGRKHQGQRLWACDPLNEQDRCVIATCGPSCEQCEDCRGNCCTNCSRCKRCITNRVTENGRISDQRLAHELWAQSCTVCRLFGSPWLASRVAFQDAHLVNAEAMLHLTEVRDGVGIDRDLGAAKTGIKYDFETVPAGARFGITIVVENAERWEIGLLLLALEAMDRAALPVGGKSTRGLGWGTLEDVRIKRIEAQHLLDWLAGTYTPAPLNAQELIAELTAVLQ